MKRYIKIAFIIGLILVLYLVCFNPSIGLLPESDFHLSPDSRLPKWFTVPAGYSRDKLDVEISYYAPLFGNDVKAVLIGPSPEFKKLVSKVGKSRRDQRFDPSNNPFYNFVTIDGIEEIIEHRWKGDIVYISDVPAVSEQERLTVLRTELASREAKLLKITDEGDRIFELESLAELSLAALQYDKASMYSKELLDFAAQHPKDCLADGAAQEGKYILEKIELIKKGKK